MANVVKTIASPEELQAGDEFARFLTGRLQLSSVYQMEASKTLHDYMTGHFHLLSELHLRQLVNVALEFRDEKRQAQGGSVEQELLGVWAVIIDTMKVIILERRDLASKNFQQLIKYGMAGDLAQVDKFLQLLYRQGYVDHLLVGVLEEMKKAVEKQNENHYYMLVYFENTLTSLSEDHTLKITPPLLRGLTQLYVSTVATASAAASPSSSAAAASSNTASNVQETAVGSEEESTLSASTAAMSVSEEVPSSSALPSNKVLTTSASGLSEASNTTQLTPEEVEELTAAGELLNKTIKDAAGNMTQLQQRLYQLILEKKANSVAFLKALQDNIEACEYAGYQNKLKLLMFIRDYIQQQDQELKQREQEVGIGNDEHKADGSSFMSTHHAPKFVDESRRKLLVPEIMTYQSLLDGTKADILEKEVKNHKKKSEKKEAKRKVQSLAEHMSDHLNTHGWVVVDNFIPLDVVRRVRIEFDLFREHFEQAEIWIGKKADVGAHLRVPSVRGDQVLWMCGGHQILGNDLEEDKDGEEDGVVQSRKGSRAAPEGVTRVIKTHGEIEPCKLKVKASAPARRFHALKEVVTACDKIVEELKGKNQKCKGVYERSDAMLALYPGEGTRFANHIDNTTQDGRRLTLLVYLNPGWKEEQGGALRLTEPGTNSVTVDGQEVQSCKAIDVFPHAGRLAMFFSSEIPHEVMPTFADRGAMTVWYYDREERKQAILRAREDGTAQAIAKTSVESQQDAKTFIGELMGGDEIGEDGGDPTAEELSTLAQRVVNLPDEAIEIVSSITGAPSVQSFRQGFPMLTTQDLKSMRALFRRMGLQG